MKKQIRREMMEKRKIYDKDYGSRLALLIKEDPIFKKAKTVAIFYPMADEINLLSLLDTDKRIVFPKVIGKEMQFYEVKDLAKANLLTSFLKSSFGVMEPINGRLVSKDEIDLVITPLLAYDKDLYRLGYGGGYYDRYFCGYKGFKMGVAYPNSYVDTLPHDQYDIPLDKVVSL